MAWPYPTPAITPTPPGQKQQVVPFTSIVAYPVATMPDGRIMYSDGSVRGTPKVGTQTQAPPPTPTPTQQPPQQVTPPAPTPPAGRGDTEFEMLEKMGGSRNPVQESRYQELRRQYEVSLPSVPSAEDFARQQEEARRAELARIAREEETLLGEFTTKTQALEKPSVAYARLAEEAGVPKAEAALATTREQIAKTRDLLDRLEEDITARTSGFLVSEAQRRRTLAAEEAPLRTQLGRLATGMEVATAGYQTGLEKVKTGLGLLGQEQERELEPLKLKMSMFSDRTAREITGFNEAKKTELTLFLDKLERQRQLSDAEMARVNELAQEERNWAKTKEEIELKTLASIRIAQAKEKGGAVTPTLGAAVTPIEGKPTIIPEVTPVPGATTDYWEKLWNELSLGRNILYA